MVYPGALSLLQLSGFVGNGGTILRSMMVNSLLSDHKIPFFTLQGTGMLPKNVLLVSLLDKLSQSIGSVGQLVDTKLILMEAVKTWLAT